MLSKDSPIITRFAPSPTGFLHLGSARTAFFNYLYARKNKGKFILRIEDTDKERSTREFEEDIINALSWLKIPYETLYKQSERTDIYKKYLKKLVDEDKAYVSKEEVKKEGHREEVIRFRNPNKKIKFADLVRGDIEFDTTDLGDFVIAKSSEEPLYHLAVVVDDFEMGITHVIRGEDHISNTPRQILIGEALGAPRPQYAHIPLILAPDRSKLSKRHGALAIAEYRNRGYMSEAICNYLALLGWNPGTDQEIFSLDELAELFDLGRVQKSGAVFDVEKLKWINREYLKKHPNEILKKIKESASDDGVAAKLLPLVMGRISTTEEIGTLLGQGELGFINLPEYEGEKLIWKESNRVNARQHLLKIREILEKLETGDSFTAEKIKDAIWEYAEKEGRGNVLWPMRYTLSGRDKSPDPMTLAFILGKNETIRRLGRAIEKLNEEK